MADTQLSFFRQRQHAWLNAIHTWLLVGGSIVLLAVVAWVFFGANGILYAAVFGGVSLFMASRVSPQIVLRMYKAQKVSPAQFPAGHAILDQLVERAGLESRPELHVVPSNMMNAFAVGRKHNSAVAMTDKLIRAMTKRELAAIMAHEITHIKNDDIKVMAIADMVSRFTSMMSTFGTFALLANIPSILFGGGAAVPWLAVLVLMFAPTAGGLLQLALSRTREYDADLGAAMLTGDPDGLASALIKLENAQKPHWEGMVLPGGRIPNPSLLRTHPRTEDRIERLMALKEAPETIEEIARGRKPAGEIIPGEMRRKLPKRPSPVPRIRRRWGRSESSKYADYASVMSSDAVKPLKGQARHNKPASKESLAPADGKPRIRITRGGVWW
ncbi:zinc metalloprotease HtpX [Salaquimonas pukyongi]|uniref:zinc metalloprotease HtpX n=1 Tax=Salaquimonas pukyongi TaxID=2712698 RepID=UPI00096BA8F9|nr:zinc metalloprotease HtpX [Salaquimonas pukyongi]